ncbi:MAG TPA: DMT family transporter [archaeon]|nr:DMT family transporter [archaeon]
MNIGLLAIIAAIICWGFGDFFIQRTTRKIGVAEALFFIGLIGSIILFPFVFSQLPLLFSTSNIFLSLLFLGLMDIFVAVVNMQAYKVGKLSVVDPILVLELPITIFLGIVILKEGISSAQFALSFLIFIGIFLVSLRKSFSAKMVFEKGVKLALITAVGMGILNFMYGTFSREASPLLAVWSASFIHVILCGAFLFFRGRLFQLGKDFAKNKKIIFAEGVFDTLAWTFYSIAMVSLPISITTAITESYPVLAVLLGIYINKEKINFNQKLGVGMTIVSAVALGMTIL